MRLAARKLPVTIVVRVFRPRNHMPKDPCVGQFYDEWLRFRPGKGTLGDLADFFEQIGCKKRVEHKLGTVRYNGEYWADVRPGTMRKPNRTRVRAAVLECCRVLASYCGLKWSWQWVWGSMKGHPFILTMILSILGVILLLGRVAAFMEAGLSQKEKEERDGQRKVPIYN